MKIKNQYTKGLKRLSGYNPNEFTALGSGIFYIVLLLTFFFLPYGLALVGFGEWLGGIEDIYLQNVISVAISQGVILIFGLVYSAIKKVNPIRGGGYRSRADLTPMLFGCAIIVGIQICLTAFHTEFYEHISYFGSALGLEDNVTDAEGSPLWALVYLIMVPVLPCICEEIVFRGILMRGFSRFGIVASVILSSLMFSLFHGNYAQLVLQFFGGVAIGACVYLTKNFAVGVVMHFCNNLFAICYAMLLGLSSAHDALYSGVVAGASILGIALLIIGLLYFVRMYSKKAAGEKYLPEFGKPVNDKKKVLMSCESRAESSSIAVGIDQVQEFKKYYPDAMRFKKGAFVSLNKERKSPAGAIIVIALGILLAVAAIVVSEYGI